MSMDSTHPREERGTDMVHQIAGGARMKLVVVPLSVLFVASCASSPEPGGARQSSATPGSGGAMVNSRVFDPAGPTSRDTFKVSIFGAQPQRWTMLCEHSELSVGVRNDATTLFVRAVVWSDDDDALGVEPASRQPLGDLSQLMIHFGSDNRRTAGRDLDISLNIWPQVQGVRLQRHISPGITSTLQEFLGASGSISYASDPDGKVIRTDAYELPLDGLDLQQGAAIGVSFYALSSVPAFATSCAAGLERGNFYPPSIPVATFLPLELQ